MTAWLGVHPLRVCRRDIAQDLNLRLDHAERLRVRAPDGSPTTLSYRRFADLLFPKGDDLFQEPIEIRIECFHLWRIAHEFQGHLSALLLLKSTVFATRRRSCPGVRLRPRRCVSAVGSPPPSGRWQRTSLRPSLDAWRGSPSPQGCVSPASPPSRHS